ncbi:putative P-loop containing nucleoside triphosphate hydrolase [Rosa chinensis]|uniref:Putative P-loop containing nucleoside triphosphate hydrolase n=1 Tax=Rosa chinensis TaxID=74649 RepID=A0A2P6RAP1_ROSCH|nr:putative P-loop containing nucleoside triphosphate hydrolase [Rosa chinensis]
MDKVMKALQDDEVTVVGVYGMGGIGKTTMVEHVGAQACNTGLFDHVIMAVVSQSPDFRKIQGTLADLLELKLEGETEVGRARILQKEIISRNKILIILDDIWEMIDLSRIGIPSYGQLQRRNSKVLLTTRRFNVCHSMESQSSIPLNILSEEDSWKLFVKKARKSFENSTNFYDIARKVARECAGLPVALIAVARALGDKDLDEWKEAARRLKASQPVHPEDGRVVLKYHASYFAAYSQRIMISQLRTCWGMGSGKDYFNIATHCKKPEPLLIQRSSTLKLLACFWRVNMTNRLGCMMSFGIWPY